MNHDNGEIQENGTTEEGGDTHPPIPPVDGEKSYITCSKGAQQGNNAAPLQQITYWSRFKKWISTATAAEVGMLLLTIAIAVSSIVYTKYAKRQWKAMNDSNIINREALESVQRAFMTCGDINQNRNSTHNGDGSYSSVWTFWMPCVNTGTTPANVIAQAFATDYISDEPTDEQFKSAEIGRQTAAVGPRSSRNVGNFKDPETSLFGKQLPYDLRSMVGKTTEQVDLSAKSRFFWGWIAYRDVFPWTGLHITEFCEQAVQANVVSHDVGSQPGFSFLYASCRQHNCADEYCEDYQAIINLAAKK